MSTDADRKRAARASRTPEEQAEQRRKDAERKARARATQDPQTRARETEARRARRYRADPDPRRERDAARKREERLSEATPFVAVDGEAIQVEAGQVQPYVLLSDSTGRSLIAQDRAAGLGTREILEWLLALKAKRANMSYSEEQDRRARRVVGYFINYDVAHWLKDIPEALLTQLWAYGATEWPDPLPGREACRYYLSYIPGRYIEIHYLRLVPKDDKIERIPLRYCRIDDVSGFFQTSFVVALQEWGIGTAEDRAYIAALKQQRAGFTGDRVEEIKAYNVSECQLLVQLMEKLDATFTSAGYRLNQWHGAGALAQRLLTVQGMKAQIVRPPNEHVDTAIMAAYFGGRIQALQIGLLGDVHIYDLRSAYPWAATLLPDLDGEWEYADGHYDPEEPWALWHVRRTFDPDRIVPPLPHRLPDKRVIWPLDGEGWYWSVELAAMQEAIEAGEIEIDHGLIYRPGDEAARPFRWIHDLYDLRRAYRAAEDPRQWAIKLGLNAIYGKLAQGSSFENRTPAFQSYMWAGLITAICRAALYRAASQDPEAIVAFSTDSIISRRPLQLDIGEGLGQWEHTQAPDFFLIYPGAQHSPSGAHQKDATDTYQRFRGIPRHSVTPRLWATLRRKWQEFGTNMEHPITMRPQFFGLGMAQAHGWRSFRRWYTPKGKVRARPTIQREAQIEERPRVHRLYMAEVREIDPWSNLHSTPYQPKRPYIDERREDPDQLPEMLRLTMDQPDIPEE